MDRQIKTVRQNHAAKIIFYWFHYGQLKERERESVHKKERESFLADVIIISERR